MRFVLRPPFHLEVAKLVASFSPSLSLCLLLGVVLHPPSPFSKLLTPTNNLFSLADVYRFCSPTRASFLTGRIPGHGIWETNPYIDATLGTNLNLTMIPAKLKKAGCKDRCSLYSEIISACFGPLSQPNHSPQVYPVDGSFIGFPSLPLARCALHLDYTAAVGKWHQGFYAPQYLPHSRGFDSSFGYLSGAEDHNTQCGDAACHGIGHHCGVRISTRFLVVPIPRPP